MDASDYHLLPSTNGSDTGFILAKCVYPATIDQCNTSLMVYGLSEADEDLQKMRKLLRLLGSSCVIERISRMGCLGITKGSILIAA